MRLPRLAVQRPITTAMILISVLVMGGIALAELPLAYLPEVDAPFIGVQVPYPNSNPQQVEKEIVKPVEEILATLSGVKTLNAQADPDQAQFFLEFDWGQDLDIVRMQVSEKMDQIKPDLPATIGEIVIFSFNTNDMPVVQARVSAKGSKSPSSDSIRREIIASSPRRHSARGSPYTVRSVELRRCFLSGATSMWPWSPVATSPIPSSSPAVNRPQMSSTAAKACSYSADA